jgi:hypothetical protein
VITTSLTRAVFAAAAIMATSAFADTVTLDFNHAPNPSPAANVNIKLVDSHGSTTSSFNGAAGVMNFTVTGVSGGKNDPFSKNEQIQTFCIDAASPLADPDTYTINYSPFVDNNATLLSELYKAHFGDIGTDGNKAAAFQVAIWEIVYDAPNSGTYTVPSDPFNTGTFRDNNFFGWWGTSSTILNTAQSWLNDFQTKGANSNWVVYELDANSAGGCYSGQSQIFAQPGTVTNIPTPPVPLPPALPAGIALLGGTAIVRKLRQRR